MPNKGGTNQFQGFGAQPPYGSVGREAQLMKSAPVAGAQYATPALQTPTRAKKATQRRGGPQGASPTPMAPPAPPAQISPQFAAAQAWQEIAAIPGASDLVKMYAAKAAQGG